MSLDNIVRSWIFKYEWQGLSVRNTKVVPVISLFHLCNKRYHTCAGYPNFSTILEEWNNKNKKNKNEKERDVRLAEVIYSRFLRVARSGWTACRVSLDDGNVVCCHLPFTCPVLVISCYPLCRLYSLAK